MTYKKFTTEQARIIGEAIGIDFNAIYLDEFRMGLSIELEHGSHDPETNVIDNDEHLAGKIAWAHLKEIRDYYTRLAKMESEGESYWRKKIKNKLARRN